ncbi:MAG: COX15/CtaA family protein [Acidobacteriota bacterium]
MSDALSLRPFRRLALATVVAVYLLIGVGGLVRASGAGMGCPDWPKCFGQWVPPTAESQLPANYQEIYAEHGYGSSRFNVVKTWTEYINRLIGVVIGFLIFGTWIASWRTFRGRDGGLVAWCFSAFLLVGFQGWLGSVVVDSNLAPWLVTVHMILALVIVGILIYALARSQREVFDVDAIEPSGRIDLLFAACLVLSMVQIGLGSQIREHIDELGAAAVARADWIESLGLGIYVHRSLSLLVFAANVALVWSLRQASRTANSVASLGNGLLVVLALEIAVGAVMFYFAVPAFLQPVHLVLAAVGGGLQLGMLIGYRYSSGSRAAGPLPATT